jgi:hypothetical protein
MGRLPVALRPAWSGSSFLVYAGAFTVLVSLGVLLGTLGDMQGSTALVAWSALVLVILVALSVAASRDGRPVVAGLCAFVAVAVVAVVAGSLLDAVGIGDGASLFDDDLELAPLLGEIAVLVAALYAARKLRFPLLLLAATVAKAVLVLDTVAGVFGTGNWIAWAALLLGLAELGTTATLRGDRSPWAFWKHVAAALLIGGATVWLLHGGDVGWVLIGVVSLAYLAVARSSGRSVWAVVGAVGLLIVTTHFVDDGDAVIGMVPLLPFELDDGGGLDVWQTALVYTGLGVVFVLLGRLLRQPTLHEREPG